MIRSLNAPDDLFCCKDVHALKAIKERKEVVRMLLVTAVVFYRYVISFLSPVCREISISEDNCIHVVHFSENIRIVSSHCNSFAHYMNSYQKCISLTITG